MLLGAFAAAGLLDGFVGCEAAEETEWVGFAAVGGTAAGAGLPFFGAIVSTVMCVYSRAKVESSEQWWA